MVSEPANQQGEGCAKQPERYPAQPKQGMSKQTLSNT